jgi:hypothetical protein
LVPSSTVAFPYHFQAAAFEEICVVCHPNFPSGPEEAQRGCETATAVSEVVSMITNKASKYLIPFPKELLEKSSLGKISRTKARAAFEKGDFIV